MNTFSIIFLILLASIVPLYSSNHSIEYQYNYIDEAMKVIHSNSDMDDEEGSEEEIEGEEIEEDI
jgi:hypothetical protein